MSKKIIAITGTPGTGKTTISEKLASTVPDSELIRANELVKRLKLYNGRDEYGSLLVDMKGLKKEIDRRIKKSGAKVVIAEGHLLCDMKIDGATAVVLREHLKTLEKRLKERGYPRKKIEDNIVSEAIDYCGVNAEQNYGKAYEIECGADAVKRIAGIIEGKSMKKKEIELLPELDGFLG